MHAFISFHSCIHPFKIASIIHSILPSCIHPPIHKSIQSSIIPSMFFYLPIMCPSINLCIYQSIIPCICLWIHPFIIVSIIPSIHPSCIHPPICKFIQSSINPLIHVFMFASIISSHPACIHHSNIASIHSSFYPSFFPSTFHPSTNQPTNQPNPSILLYIHHIHLSIIPCHHACIHHSIIASFHPSMFSSLSWSKVTWMMMTMSALVSGVEEPFDSSTSSRSSSEVLTGCTQFTAARARFWPLTSTACLKTTSGLWHAPSKPCTQTADCMPNATPEQNPQNQHLYTETRAATLCPGVR